MSARSLVLAALAASVALVAVYLAAGGSDYEPTPVAGPCEPREWRSPEGVEESAEQFALSALDGAACELGVSRETLAVALATPDAREEFAAEYGIKLYLAPNRRRFVAHHIPELSLLTLAVATATLLVLIGMERLWPHSPAPLVAVGGGIAAAWFFGLQALGVSTVGLIPQGLPSLTMPDLALIEQLLPGALGIALMSFTESIAAGRAFARPGDPSIDANRELIATGAANLGGAVLGAMPAGGGTSQTAVVRAAGGRSQKASLVTAGTAAATMLLLAPLLGLLPNATLAAVVIVYSVGLIQPVEFFAIRKVRTMEFHWAIIAALGVVLFGTLKGIVVAIIMSLISLSSQAAYPRVSIIGRKRGADVLRPLSPEYPDDETFEGLLIVRPEGRLFFVNAQYVADQIGALVAQHKPRVLAVDMSRVPDIEYSALQMLIESDKRATERGAVVWLVGLNPGALEVVRKAGLDERLGRERMLFNARAAIERYQALQAGAGGRS